MGALQSIRSLWISPADRDLRDAGGITQRIRSFAAELSVGVEGRVLEIGCGEGMLLRMLQIPGCSIFGVSLDLPPLIHARGIAPPSAKLLQADAASLPFRDGSFEMILCVNTLTSFSGWEPVLKLFREARRLLAPGGSLVLDLRSAAHPLNQLNWLASRWGDASLGRPVRPYRLSEVMALLHLAGLEGEVAAWGGPRRLPLFRMIRARTVHGRKRARNGGSEHAWA